MAEKPVHETVGKLPWRTGVHAPSVVFDANGKIVATCSSVELAQRLVRMAAQERRRVDESAE